MPGGAVADAAVCTCPMSPAVQVHPGSRPKCCRVLVPELPVSDADANPELADFRRRLGWTLPLTVVATPPAVAGRSSCAAGSRRAGAARTGGCCPAWRRRPRVACAPTAPRTTCHGPRARGRPAAHAAGREGAGRRRADRRVERGRRVDAHRRAGAGEQAPRRQADRRDAGHRRRRGCARNASARRPRCRSRCRWWRARSDRRRRGGCGRRP